MYLQKSVSTLLAFKSFSSHAEYKLDYLYFLLSRRDVLDELVKLQNFEDQFLPNALRKFFNETRPPNERGSYLHTLVEKFSERFCACNPNLGLSKGQYYAFV